MIQMVTMTRTGLLELSMLVSEGFKFKITKATDGTDIVLAWKDSKQGRLTRHFNLIISTEEN